MTDLQKHFAEHFSGQLRDLDEQIAAMERGVIRVLSGSVDITGDAIELAKRQRDTIRKAIGTCE